MRTSILYVIGSLNLGGTERHLVKLLPQLNSFGFDCKVVTLFNRGIQADILESEGIPVLTPSFPKILNEPKSRILKIAKLLFTLFYLFKIMRIKADIHHFFLPAAYIIGCLVSFFFRPQLRIMSRRSLNHYANKHPFAHFIEKRLHKYMDMCLANSQAVYQNLLEEGVKVDKVEIIHNGIEFQSEDRKSMRVQKRTELGIKQDAFVFIKVANLIKYKGHEDVLNALGMIKSELGDNWKVLFVGYDSGIRNKLSELSRKLEIEENIIFLGSRLDVSELLCCSDVALLCSHEEGFSNSLLEYMAHGLPIIATDVGGNSEAVNNGKTGIIIEKQNKRELQEAILKLFCNQKLRNDYGDAARKRVEEKFSIDTCVKKYTYVYEKMLKNNAKKE